MFRLLHIGSKLGFNLVKDSLGFPCEKPADILERMGGAVYLKASQATNLNDPDAAVYSECVPWDAPRLYERLKEYCATHGFEPESFVYVASGSVGGVFRGPSTVDGSDWVVKIQYEGIYDQFKDDMDAITVAGGLLLSAGRQSVLDQTYALFENEFDYDLEIRNLESVYDIWKDDETIRVPKVLPAQCDTGVIAMEYMPGVPLGKYVKTGATSHTVDVLADRIATFVLVTWSRGIVFADPHWGNFLVGDNTELQVVDFGTIYRMRDDVPTDLSLFQVYDLIRQATSRESFSSALRANVLSSIIPDIEQACDDFFSVYSLFNSVIDGRTTLFNAGVMERVQDLLNRDVNTPISPSFTAVTRSILMTINMLCHMNANANLGGIIDRLDADRS